MQSQSKLLFVDDHAGLIMGLGSILKTKHDSIDFFYASNKEDALSILRDNNIQCLILDLNLNMEDGLDFIDDFRTVSPNLKILAFTMYNDFFHIDKALSHNIQGYVTKDCDINEFENAILSVLDGKTFFNSQATKIIQKISSNQSIYNSDDDIANFFSLYKSLTPKEKEIFELTANLKDIQEIAKILNKSERTVQNQKNSIFAKMKLNNNTELLKVAKILGFII